MNKISFQFILLFIFYSNYSCKELEEILSCGKDLCYAKGSICFLDKCVCRECYITVDIENNYSNCNYSQKSSFIGFLLEFFIPFGIGHFYLGNIFSGIIKISFCLICFIFGFYIAINYFLFFKTFHNNQNEYKPFNDNLIAIEEEIIKVKKFENYLKILFLTYHVYDLVLFLLGKYKDSNNQLIC